MNKPNKIAPGLEVSTSSINQSINPCRCLIDLRTVAGQRYGEFYSVVQIVSAGIMPIAYGTIWYKIKQTANLLDADMERYRNSAKQMMIFVAIFRPPVVVPHHGRHLVPLRSSTSVRRSFSTQSGESGRGVQLRRLHHHPETFPGADEIRNQVCGSGHYHSHIVGNNFDQYGSGGQELLHMKRGGRVFHGFSGFAC